MALCLHRREHQSEGTRAGYCCCSLSTRNFAPRTASPIRRTAAGSDPQRTAMCTAAHISDQAAAVVGRGRWTAMEALPMAAAHRAEGVVVEGGVTK